MNIEWNLLVVGALVSGLVCLGGILLLVACVFIGKALADRNDRKAERLIAMTPDEVFVDAIRKWDGQ